MAHFRTAGSENTWFCVTRWWGSNKMPEI